MNEDLSTPEKPAGVLAPLTDFLAAVQFLTILPPILKRPFTPRELGRSVGYYPMVGFGLGVLLVGANFIFGRLFPQAVSAALVLALWVLLTGALHVDGFLDAVDGLLGGFTPESRLEILRDNHKGAFAVAAGIILFLVKFTTLLSVTVAAPAALLIAPILGRWGMSLAVVAFPYARPEGLGKDMKDNANWEQAILASVVALLAAVLTAGLNGFVALVVAAIVLLLGTRFTLRRIPGLTGDIYGMLNELIEVAVLLWFCVKLA